MSTDTMRNVLRRWLFRGMCLALLALCATVWVGSYWRWGEWVASDDRHLKVLHVGAGSTYAFGGEEHRPYAGAWRGGPTGQKDAEYAAALFGGMKYSVLGFAVDGDASVGGFDHRWFAGMPLWFPTAVSALLLGLVWRKTRWHQSERGFKVAAARGW